MSRRTNSAASLGLFVFILLMPAVVGKDRIQEGEYLLRVEGDELRFLARPELGYVVKARQDVASIEAMDAILQRAGAVDIRPIGGLGRKGVSIVHSERPVNENERTIKSLLSSTDIQYAAPLFSINGETVAIIPEIVVRVRPDIEIEQVEAICETAGCIINKRMEFTEQEYLLDVLGSDAKAVFFAVEQLCTDPCVEWACPNTAFQPKLYGQSVLTDVPYTEHLGLNEAEEDVNTPGIFPDDEFFPMQWHLYNTGQSGGTPGADIRAPEAWEITTGDPNIIIAVVDCGVDTNHPDLINNLIPGYDFWDNDDQPDPAIDNWFNAHGTACSGLVAAQGNNGIGVTGVTWDCKIMPLRIISDASGGPFVSMADIATAFRWAATHGADIFSDSVTFYSSPQPIVQSAIVDVTIAGGIGRNGKGCVFLTATANSSGPMEYPERYPEVISVSATDHNDSLCWYTSHGSELDIVAPGGGGIKTDDLDEFFELSRGLIWTTDIAGPPGISSYPSNPNGNIFDYTTFNGSSAACPITAGIAALILSVDPNLTNLEVQRILYRSARDLGEPGWDQYYGWGRVDARAAVEIALNPPPPSVIYVDDDSLDDPGLNDPEISDPNEDGSSEHPFDAIQEAINHAVPGDTVIVLPGTYTGSGNRDTSFFGRAITVRSLDPNDFAIVAATVIDCQGTQSSQHQGFLFNKGESNQSVLSGLTITNANKSYGGAVDHQ